MVLKWYLEMLHAAMGFMGTKNETDRQTCMAAGGPRGVPID